MAWDVFAFEGAWLHVKLLLVVALSALSRPARRRVREFAADANTHSATYYRMLNEVPTVLMIGIVIMVIVKPW